MTQEFRSTICSLFLPVSHRQGSPWPLGTYVRASARGQRCGDPGKEEPQRTMPGLSRFGQQHAFSNFTVVRGRVFLFSPLLSKFSGIRKEKRQWQINGIEEK